MNEVLNNKKKSEILAEKIKELNYGDIIKHDQIADVVCEKYPSNKYSSIISKTRKLLENNGIFLESINGDGYRIVEPDEVVGHSLKHYKRGFKEMNKGYKTLENAPIEKMTDGGREIFRRTYDRATTLNAAMKGVSIELKTLGSKKHPFITENIATH